MSTRKVIIDGVTYLRSRDAVWRGNLGENDAAIRIRSGSRTKT